MSFNMLHYDSRNSYISKTNARNLIKHHIVSHFQINKSLLGLDVHWCAKIKDEVHKLA